MRGFLISIFLSLSVILTTSCSMQKDMEQMLSATGDLSKQTSDMTDIAGHLGVDLPIAMGYINMNNYWQYVIDDNSGDTTKLAQAAAYFEAMPYQFWTGSHQDTIKVRDDKMFNDIQFFIFNVDQFIDHKFKIPDGIGLANDHYRILSAMATAMSQINPGQKRMASENNFTAYSIYDIAVDALVNKDLYRKTTMPQHVRAILQFENEFRYLMQVRYNHLLLFSTSLLTYFGDKCMFEKLWEMMTASKFSQKVDLAQFSNERLAWVNEILQAAEDTRATIKQLGDKLQYSTGVKKIFRAMKPIRSEAKSENRQKIETELIGHLNALAN